MSTAPTIDALPSPVSSSTLPSEVTARRSCHATCKHNRASAITLHLSDITLVLAELRPLWGSAIAALCGPSLAKKAYQSLRRSLVEAWMEETADLTWGLGGGVRGCQPYLEDLLIGQEGQLVAGLDPTLASIGSVCLSHSQHVWTGPHDQATRWGTVCQPILSAQQASWCSVTWEWRGMPETLSSVISTAWKSVDIRGSSRPESLLAFKDWICLKEQKH